MACTCGIKMHRDQMQKRNIFMCDDDRPEVAATVDVGICGIAGFLDFWIS
jgi:hypothetical protein